MDSPYGTMDGQPRARKRKGRAKLEGLFKGICLNGSVSISHLFYADDAMFIGEWSDANLRGIINILKCFFLASGLQININKSQVLRVGVPRLIVERAASSFGCTILQNQFRYLGVMVGRCMSRNKEWADVVLKLRSRLSKWKVKTLFIGGLEIRVSRWFALVSCRSSVGMEIILGFGQIFGRVMDLLRKFFRVCLRLSWTEILVAVKVATSVDHSLRRPIRGGVEQQQRTNLALLMDSVSLLSSQDRWVCDLSGDGEFRVKEIWNYIDDMFLPVHPEPTRWVKYIPIKINVFTWRARRDCLPTMVQLIQRGVTLESTNCPLCRSCEEDIHHVFFDVMWLGLFCVACAVGGI
nr:RNA-directed DNA polymerase, eukaryota [Tanacetum cinerariifolium]